jgi:hypothetical protein
MISAAALAAMAQEVAQVPESEVPDLSAIEKMPELLGFIVANARHLGEGEADMVEMFCRLAGMSGDEVRRHERTLRPLGYTLVCDRLKAIAGRRKGSLVPPV